MKINRMKLYLFLYGTLKSNHYNHPRFGLDDPKVGTIVDTGTVEGYGLRVIGGLPYAAAVAGEGPPLRGEIYEVNDARLFLTLHDMEMGAGYDMGVVNAASAAGAVYQCIMFCEKVLDHRLGMRRTEGVIYEY